MTDETLTDEYDLAICPDCACWHANGDLSALDLLDDDERAERYAAVTAAPGVPDGYHVVVGTSVDSDFRWRACDTCGGPASDRLPATLLRI